VALTCEQMPAVVLAALETLSIPIDDALEAVISVTLDRNPFHALPGGSWHALLWAGQPEARDTALLTALRAVETRCDGAHHTAMVEVQGNVVALSWID